MPQLLGARGGLICMEGWVLGIYPDHLCDLMAVWLKDQDGKAHRLVDLFEPSFYAGEGKGHLSRLVENLFLLFGYTAERIREALSGQKQATLVGYAMER